MARLERLHVVGHLALQELERLAAAQHELAALGAIDEPDSLA